MDGTMTSNNHVTQATTIDVININTGAITNGSKVSYNAPIYRSEQVSGFSQSISGFSITANPSPSRYSDMVDPYGNHYRHFEWDLKGVSASSLRITVTTSFDPAITGEVTPITLNDGLGTGAMSQFLSPTSMAQSSHPAIVSKKNELIAGATTQREATERIIDFVRSHLSIVDPDRPKDAVSTLSDNRGNCVNRANLAMALLRSAGIPTRYVSGQIYHNTLEIWYNVPEGLAQRTFNWDNGPHSWIEVYYPDEGIWVAYDPFLSKGFVDHRHIKYAVSLDGNIADRNTHGEPGMLVVSEVNPECQASIQASLSVTNVADSDPKALQYRSTKQSPVPFMISRDLQASANKASNVQISYQPSNAYVNSPLSISVLVDPARSDGTVTIKRSPDGNSWEDVSSGAPSFGRYTFTSTPSSPVLEYYKASWSGASGYPAAESQIISVNIVNRSIVITPSPSGIISPSPIVSPDPLNGINDSAFNNGTASGTGNLTGQNNTTINTGIGQCTGDNGILAGRYMIKGRVVSRETGNPISDAVIVFNGSIYDTDSSGNFSFGAFNGSYLIKANATGYSTKEVKLVVNGSDVQAIIDLDKEISTATKNGTGIGKIFGIPGFGMFSALISGIIVVVWIMKKEKRKN
jgi:transglutaminase-like putative cysteine protease